MFISFLGDPKLAPFNAGQSILKPRVTQETQNSQNSVGAKKRVAQNSQNSMGAKKNQGGGDAENNQLGLAKKNQIGLAGKVAFYWLYQASLF